MKQHRFDGVSFVAGIVITAIGALFLLAEVPTDIFDSFEDVSDWIWPVVAVAVGIAILVPALARSRREPEG